MKKIGFGMFCVALCLTVAFVFPQMGTSEEMVNSESCLLCHNFAADEGDHTITGHDAVCGLCHEGGITTVGNVASSKCIVCHPIGDVGEYALVNQHDPGMEGTCLSCHTTTDTDIDVDASDDDDDADVSCSYATAGQKSSKSLIQKILTQIPALLL
ncbi:MAG: hypothetical protein GY762_07240 [Proteobacteria bacterium]|nr:hypothetical protein [Pseudomonadota bacterium]